MFDGWWMQIARFQQNADDDDDGVEPDAVEPQTGFLRSERIYG